MEKIITNDDNLKETDMTEVVKRVKILMINSNKELLLGYSHNNYQFPGGHVEDNESLVDAVKREVKEETGIVLKNIDVEPFALAVGYYKDWPEVGRNRKTEIYYYEIKTDELPDLNNTSYTNNELDGNFELKYIPLDILISILEENASLYPNSSVISKEMINVINIYMKDSE